MKDIEHEEKKMDMYTMTRDISLRPENIWMAYLSLNVMNPGLDLIYSTQLVSCILLQPQIS